MKKVNILNNQFLIESPLTTNKVILMIKFFMKQGLFFGTDFFKKSFSFFFINFLIKKTIQTNLPKKLRKTLYSVLEDNYEKKYKLIGLVSLSFGGYIGIIKIKENYFILRITYNKNQRNEKEKNGIKIFSQITKLKVPKLIFFEQINGFDISIQTALYIPYFRDFYVPSKHILLNTLGVIINEKSYDGLISESKGFRKTIQFIESNLHDSPKWFKSWFLNFEWLNLDKLIGINSIGPIHGDINKNNCWYKNSTLFLVDFEMFEDSSPMFIDLIKWKLFGDLNLKPSVISKRVKRVLKKGIQETDLRQYGFDNFNKKEDLRAGILLITLLFECYWILKRNISFRNSYMHAITSNIKYLIDFLNY